ncbi:hypothetical protein R1sor_015350 [Riccia sorocarpa]|uniref:Uncharacterized protein n=1 Tax=Riccia sorocarpa TaxID=122646 RepID=A0ABD3HDT4_9MARC
MSPRSPDGRSIKDLATEEDREQHYFERQEPEDESDPIDKKETSWDEETVHEEFTSRRPPSPFASFLRETRDPQAWINSLMWTGFKKPLEIVDLPSLPEWDDADAVHKRFSTFWSTEQQKVKRPVNSLLTYIQGTPTRNFMFRIFGQHFGYYTAAALLIVPTARSFTDNAILQIMLRMGMNMKTALIKTVYHKSLKLSNSARQSKSVGEIVILMQVDTEKVNGASPFLQNTWSALVQVLGNVALLLYYMGWSSLVGIGLLVLIVPLQGRVVQKMMLIQRVSLKNTGRRVKVINEVLQGVRVVKAYAWEEPFTSTINRVRDLELRSMRSRVYLRAIQTCLMLATPVLITVVSFAIYAGVQKKNMTAATVFTSLSLFNSLRQPLMMYPFVINGVLTGYVSLKRLSRFMQSEEMHPIPRGPIVDDKPVLYIEKSTFQWVATEVTSKRSPTVSTSGIGIQAFCLRNISLTVNRGQIIAVVGPVGSGKSSLAAALLGEMQQVSGDTFTANGRLAYCAQQAWIMNASLKDNILFGLEYDEGRYRAVLTACALDQDLVNLPDGDETEIGERGINLSGGQKQRVSLARAVYADMDVYLLDDPLSAVDAHVGAHLFSKCIMGFLSDKTRIFITNQLQYAPSVDHIVVLEDGRVAEQGKFQDLVSKEGEFSRLMQETGIQKEEESDIETSDNTMSPVNWGGVERKGMLVQDEYRTRGTLDLSVYKNYWTETSYVMPLCVLALYCAVQCLDAFNRYWLAYWTRDHFHQSTAFYLGIYAGLGIFFAGLLYFRMLSQLMLGLWTAKKFHEGVLQSILRAPMSFFDTTPVGRILNRFSADQQAVDETLPFTWVSFLNILFQAFSTIIVISLNTPIFLLIFLPTSILYAFIQQVYRRTARELKRLGSLSISPVYQQFTETLNGLPTIRAYQHFEDRFMEMCAGHLLALTGAVSFCVLKSSH